MAGNARAFFADRLFRNLHQDFLAFFQQIADLWDFLRRLAARKTAAATTTAASATTVVPGPWTRRALGVARRSRRSPNLGAGIDCASTAGFRVEQRFGFILRLFQFQLLGVFLALRRGTVHRRQHAGLG